MTVAVIMLASLITLVADIALHAVLHHGTLHLTYMERDDNED